MLFLPQVQVVVVVQEDGEGARLGPPSAAQQRERTAEGNAEGKPGAMLACRWQGPRGRLCPRPS